MIVWKISTVTLILCSCTTLTIAASAKLTLYKQGLPDPIVINGDDCNYGVTFNADSSDFSCACMIGLWAFYHETCGAPTLITGGIEEKCIQLDQKVIKVHLLSSPGGFGDTATIFSGDMKMAKARIETEGDLQSVPFKHSGLVKVVATGTNSWGMKPSGSCLAPELPDQTLFGSSPQFCTFTHNTTLDATLYSTCDADEKIIPTTCVPYLEGSTQCPSTSSKKGRAIVKSSAVASKGKAITKPHLVAQKGKAVAKASSVTPKGKAVAPKDKSIAKPHLIAQKGKAVAKASSISLKGKTLAHPFPVAPKGKGITKASSVARKGKSAGKSRHVVAKGKSAKRKSHRHHKGKGRTVPASPHARVFLGVVKGMENMSNETEPRRKMTQFDVNMNLTVDLVNPIMNSEIWNYLTSRAQLILNLTTEPIAKAHVTPTFRFLELAKEILQKTCPNSYVPDEHFDMAFSTFASLQTKHYNFKDDFSDYATGMRIEESLKFCRDNMTVYPFIDSTNRTKETCNKTIEMGTFEAFGKFSELVLPFNAASRENEPIVETVWKMFTHAHSACYNHFAEGFNDHHRFTSILMPLFTNEINDIWNSIKEVKANTYAGLLGDALKLMDGVAYCAEYSRLETPYPWELPRPVKDLDFAGRKRRSAANNPQKFTCLKKSFENKC